MIIWDASASSLTRLHSVSVPSGNSVNGVSFSPDGTKLASGDYSGEVIIWDASASSLTQLHSVSVGSGNAVWSVSFSPDGTKLASGDSSGTVAVNYWMAPFPPILNLSNTSIIASTAAYGGGVLVSTASATLTNVTIEQCHAHAHGDALAVQSANLTLESTLVARNSASTSSGGLWARNSSFYIYRSAFSNNSAPEDAALLYASSWVLSPSAIARSRFENNHGGEHSITLFAPISWTCSLGDWMSPTGSISSSIDFEGCPYPCAAGFVGNVTNSTLATCGGSCPPGHTCHERTIIPQPCPNGTYMPAPGAVSSDSCIPCPAGAMAPSENSTSCSPCPPGSYSAEVRATACTACPKHGYCSEVAASSLQMAFRHCPAGTFSDLEGLTSLSQCQACPDGFWCADGQRFACGVGTYTNPHAVRASLETCLPCPTHSTTRGPNTSTVEACECSADFFRLNTTCLRCPAGSDCMGIGTTLHSLAVQTSHWKPSFLSLDAKLCPYDTCANGSPPEMRYDEGSNATCVANKGVAGVYCMLCTQSAHYFSTANAECKSCGREVTLLSLFTFSILLAVGVIWFILHMRFHSVLHRSVQRLRLASKHASFLTKVKITVSYYQIITQLDRVYAVRYPPAYRALLRSLNSIFTFFFSWLPGIATACTGISFETELLLICLLPFCVVVAGIVVARLYGNEFIQMAPHILAFSYLVFPFVASRGFRALAPCDCFSYVDGGQVCFMRESYAVQCLGEYAPPPGIRVAAWLIIVVYAIGVPLGYALLIARSQTNRLSRQLSSVVHLLTKDYDARVYFWELVEVGRKMTLVGFLALVEPGSLFQLYLSVVAALAFSLLQLYTRPYRNASDNWLSMISASALTLTMLESLGVQMLNLKPDLKAVGIVALETLGFGADALAYIAGTLIVCALFVILAATYVFVQELSMADPVLRYDDGEHVALTQTKGHYHLFLSHVWGSGQDQMRIVKDRLRSMVLNVQVFLDVDDLAEGKGGEYVDCSTAFLIFVSKGYFQSVNCMRELLRAVMKGKPIVALVEPEQKHGGMTRQEVQQELREADGKYCARWGDANLSDEVRDWLANDELSDDGKDLASALVAGKSIGDALDRAIFVEGEIEWNRLSAFQTVTLRLIAERLLPTGHRPLATPRPPHLQPCILACSSANIGAAEIVDELSKAGLPISTAQAGTGRRLLLYLDARTWTQGDQSETLKQEVLAALERDEPPLLLHESSSDPGYHPAEFGSFFSTPPRELLDKGIYTQIAIPLKGGAWRAASYALVAEALQRDQGMKLPFLIQCVQRIMRRLSFSAARLARAFVRQPTGPISGKACGRSKGGLLFERDAGDTDGRQEKAGRGTGSYRDSLVESVGREYELTALPHGHV